MNHDVSPSLPGRGAWRTTWMVSIVLLAVLAAAPAAAAPAQRVAALVRSSTLPAERLPAGMFASQFTTIEVPIAAGSDDAGVNAAWDWCTYGTNHNEIYFGQCADGTGITGGFRFANVPVPRGATITDASIRFTVDGPYVGSLTVRFAGEASGDAATFSNSSRPDSRPLIPDLYADWQITPNDPWTLGETRYSPPLTAIVQTIVNRSDWASGHALAIITQNVGTASGNWPHRRVIAYERASWFPGSEYAARLVVTYADTPSIDALPAITPPAIDGDLGDWGQWAPLVLDHTTAHSAYVLPSPADLPVPDDSSAAVRAMWDGTALYFAVQVRDDVIVDDSPDVRQDDAIELSFVGAADGLPGGGDTHLVTINADGRISGFGLATMVACVEAVAVAVPGGWNVEVRIPAAYLLARRDPLAAGQVLAFDLGLRDDDDGGSWDSVLLWASKDIDGHAGAQLRLVNTMAPTRLAG
jgi:hypothetical protein